MSGFPKYFKTNGDINLENVFTGTGYESIVVPKGATVKVEEEPALGGYSYQYYPEDEAQISEMVKKDVYADNRTNLFYKPEKDYTEILSGSRQVSMKVGEKNRRKFKSIYMPLHENAVNNLLKQKKTKGEIKMADVTEENKNIDVPFPEVETEAKEAADTHVELSGFNDPDISDGRKDAMQKTQLETNKYIEEAEKDIPPVKDDKDIDAINERATEVVKKALDRIQADIKNQDKDFEKATEAAEKQGLDTKETKEAYKGTEEITKGVKDTVRDMNGTREPDMKKDAYRIQLEATAHEKAGKVQITKDLWKNTFDLAKGKVGLDVAQATLHNHAMQAKLDNLAVEKAIQKQIIKKLEHKLEKHNGRHNRIKGLRAIGQGIKSVATNKEFVLEEKEDVRARILNGRIKTVEQKLSKLDKEYKGLQGKYLDELGKQQGTHIAYTGKESKAFNRQYERASMDIEKRGEALKKGTTLKRASNSFVGRLSKHAADVIKERSEAKPIKNKVKTRAKNAEGRDR